MNTDDTIQHYDHNAGKYGDEQTDIKSFSGRRIWFIDHFVQLKAPICFATWLNIVVFQLGSEINFKKDLEEISGVIPSSNIIIVIFYLLT